jgi:ATP-binding cassette subfamily B protein
MGSGNLTHNLIFSVSNIYSFAVAFIALIRFNVWCSLLFIALSIPGSIVDVVFERKSEDFRMKSAPDVRKFSYYRWMLTDAWPAKDVRMYDLTEPLKKRYDEEKDVYRAANKTLDLKKLRAGFLSEIIKRGGEIIFIIFTILQAIDGKITVGDIALYTGFISAALGNFDGFMTVFSYSFIIYTDRMKRIFDFENIECPDEASGKRTLEKFESIVFDNVFFKYPFGENYVLNGTSFTLNAGDKLSIVGINGAGKSTVIKLMLGLYQTESGRILVNGFPITDYDIKDVRKMFSVLFQNFVQYPLTLRDNIALSDLERPAEDKEITEALKQSGIYEYFDKFENGTDSYMTRQFDDNGTELSKGQWQKIALSRVYFKNAPVIIFDEPSSALDAEAEDRIFKNFEDISEKKTGIMISHRISSARLSNKVIVLDGGKITESGTHEELIALNGLYAKLYNLQMEKYTVKETPEISEVNEAVEVLQR